MTDVLQDEIIGKPVKVTIAGEEYVLAYPVRAVILYRQKTGDNLFNSETWHKVAPIEDPERFVACLWAGLQVHHPEIKIEDLECKVDFSNAGKITKQMCLAMMQYFPKQKEANPNEPAPATEVLAAS